MYAAALRSEPPAPDVDPLASVRSRGVLALTARFEEGQTRRARVREEGALRMRFPPEAPGRLDAVIVNVAGGMAGGDVYDCAFEAGAGARLAVASAAAEKVYRALGAPTLCDVRLRAEAGSTLLFAPQETILFNGARMTRSYSIEAAPDARLAVADIVILGRAAMGERVTSLAWRDSWRLRRDGALVWADASRLVGDAHALLEAPAAGGGAHAFATLLYAAADAGARLDAVRESLGAVEGCEAAATAFDGLLVARLCAHEGHRVRAAMMGVLSRLPLGALPRSWST